MVRQTKDGFVMVWRRNQEGSSSAFLSASPGNGKLKVGTGFVQVTSVSLSKHASFYPLHYQVTASRGEESHFFLKADNRRVHYTGHTKVFMVRSYTHTAGFDEAGNLRIY